MNFDTIYPHKIHKPQPSSNINQIQLPKDILQKLNIKQSNRQHQLNHNLSNNNLSSLSFNMMSSKLNAKIANQNKKKINHNQMPDIIINNNISIPTSASRRSQIFSQRKNNFISQNTKVNSSRDRPLIKFSYNGSTNNRFTNSSSIGNEITFNPLLSQNQTQIRYQSQDHNNKKYMNVIQHSLQHASSELSKFSKQAKPIVINNSFNLNPESIYKSIPEQFHKQTVIKLGKKSITNNSQSMNFKQRENKSEYIQNQKPQTKVQLLPEQRYQNKQNMSKLQIQKSEYVPIQNHSQQYLQDILPQTFENQKNNANNYKLNINIRQNEKSYEERVDINDLNQNYNENHQPQKLKKEANDNILNANLLLEKHKANIMPEIEQEFDDLKISNLSKRIQKITNRAYLSQEGSLSQLKSIQKKNNFKQSKAKIKNSIQSQNDNELNQNQNTPYKQINFESRMNQNPQIIQQISILKQKLKEKQSENDLLKEKIKNLQIKNKIEDKQEDLRMNVKINEIQIKKLSNFLRMYRLKEKQFQLKEKKYQLNINQLQKALSEKRYKF